jgi:nitrate/TMAO reductase-like tetraheme cytochrome c subunit
MKNAFLFVALALAFASLSAFTSSGGNEYIGSKSCKACHSNAKMGGTAYKSWEKGPHAKAFETLKSAESDKIAADKGFKTKAAETKECLSCHVTGMLDAGAKFDKKFDQSEGVGCETCHGAGSAYKSKHAKDVPGGMKLGLTNPAVEGGAAEKLCVSCHNEKSPTYKKFDFKARWKEIAHPKAG